MNFHLDDRDLWDKGEVIHLLAKASQRKLSLDILIPIHLISTGGSSRYLVCEREGEDQHLPIQLPFRLILHVGHLHFNGHWTLQKRRWS